MAGRNSRLPSQANVAVESRDLMHYQSITYLKVTPRPKKLSTYQNNSTDEARPCAYQALVFIVFGRVAREIDDRPN